MISNGLTGSAVGERGIDARSASAPADRGPALVYAAYPNSEGRNPQGSAGREGRVCVQYSEADQPGSGAQAFAVGGRSALRIAHNQGGQTPRPLGSGSGLEHKKTRDRGNGGGYEANASRNFDAIETVSRSGAGKRRLGGGRCLSTHYALVSQGMAGHQGGFGGRKVLVVCPAGRLGLRDLASRVPGRTVQKNRGSCASLACALVGWGSVPGVDRGANQKSLGASFVEQVDFRRGCAGRCGSESGLVFGAARCQGRAEPTHRGRPMVGVRPAEAIPGVCARPGLRGGRNIRGSVVATDPEAFPGQCGARAADSCGVYVVYASRHLATASCVDSHFGPSSRLGAAGRAAALNFPDVGAVVAVTCGGTCTHGERPPQNFQKWMTLRAFSRCSG